MGRVSVEEAAAYAGVGKNKIWEWLSTNKLTRHKMGRRTLVDLTEVDVLTDASKRKAPTPQLMAMALRRLEKVERELEFLMYSGGYAAPVEMSNDEAKLAYRVAKNQSERARISEEDMEGLISMLETIPEEAFDIIREEKDDTHPWIPFFILGRNLKAQLRSRKDFRIEPKTQNQYHRLTRAQERLRSIALIHIEADTNADTRNSLMRAVGPYPLLGYELIRRVIWNKEKESAPMIEALSNNPYELVEEALEMIHTEMKVYEKKRAVTRLKKAIDLLQK